MRPAQLIPERNAFWWRVREHPWLNAGIGYDVAYHRLMRETRLAVELDPLNFPPNEPVFANVER